MNVVKNRLLIGGSNLLISQMKKPEQSFQFAGKAMSITKNRMELNYFILFFDKYNELRLS
jgi:hypothetical protein